MIKKITPVFALLLSSLIFMSESFSQERLALVIGNSEYHRLSLKNPENDARDFAKALRSLGFEVEVKVNASQQVMESAIKKFGRKLNEDTVGLFYFAGHGVQYDGSNYLLPIGATSTVSTPQHLRYKTVDAGYVLSVMNKTGSGLNIVILDACRDNPFRSFSRDMSEGLRKMSGAEGTIIAYSTSPGKVAWDGSGRNSPYTEQLIESMMEPGLPVELMFKQVRNRVKEKTDSKQFPWYEASLDGDFYFNAVKPSSKDGSGESDGEDRASVGTGCVCNSGFDCYKRSIAYQHNKDYSLARSCMLQSCAMGNAYGCNLVGDMYRFAEMGLAEDLTKALGFYKKGCAMGEDVSCVSVSDLE